MKPMLLALLLLALTVPRLTNAQGDEELSRTFRQAVAAGNDTTAADLMCQIKAQGVACGKDDPSAPFFRAEAELWHRRYSGAFTPPKNADALTGSTWSEVVLWSSFNRDGVSSRRATIDGVPTVRYAPNLSPDTPSYMIAQPGGTPRITIDLDLDGQVDVVFDGSSLHVTQELELVSDDAGDGRRAQWLIGPVGSKPRDNARIWIYRDTCVYMIFIDTDGDGRGNCAYWGQAAPK